MLRRSEIEDLDIVRHADSVERECGSPPTGATALRHGGGDWSARCGLRGTESLADACSPTPHVTSDLSLAGEDIFLLCTG